MQVVVLALPSTFPMCFLKQMHLLHLLLAFFIGRRYKFCFINFLKWLLSEFSTYCYITFNPSEFATYPFVVNFNLLLINYCTELLILKMLFRQWIWTFHWLQVPIQSVKEHLLKEGIEVRIWYSIFSVAKILRCTME